MVRHGVMLVGKSNSGKTACYRTLAQALNDLSKTEEGKQMSAGAKYRVINPKAQTMGQLYGDFEADTHEWKDGVLANAVRDFATDTQSPSMARWLLLDGPVDAIWIENMNTVLDDNKKLCLNSGEILTFSNSMRMIFEVEDLAVASPATVSRAGMVLLRPDDVGWQAIVGSWGVTLPDGLVQHRRLIVSLAEHFLPPLLSCVRDGDDHAMESASRITHLWPFVLCGD